MFITRRFVPVGVNAQGLTIGHVKNIVSVDAILPVKLAMNKDFQKFMSNYSKVLFQLERREKRSYLKSLLALELKQHLKTLRKLEGKMYRTAYIHKFNDIHRHKYIPRDVIMTDSVILSQFTKYFKKEISSEEAKNIYLKRYGECRKQIEFWNEFRPRKEEGYTIRVRKVIGSMDYSQSIVSKYSYVNIKQYDKKTRMVTTRGQKADTSYSWFYDGKKGGWKFLGLESGELRQFALNNGCKETKLKYGDYANFMLNL